MVDQFLQGLADLPVFVSSSPKRGSFIPPWARASDMSMSFRLTVYIDVRWGRGVVDFKQPDHESIRETFGCQCLTMAIVLSGSGLLTDGCSMSRKVSYWVSLVDLA